MKAFVKAAVIAGALVPVMSSADMSIEKPSISVDVVRSAVRANGRAYVAGERSVQFAMAIDEHVAWVDQKGFVLAQAEHVATRPYRNYILPSTFSGYVTIAAEASISTDWVNSLVAPEGFASRKRWWVARPEGVVAAGDVYGPSAKSASL